ncbi:MAG: RsmD family RNA methyltransferase [Candidatus Latescibacterota bacterium]|nr:RsmD family RNA methyltransferase [Candidatus Latescibacterota bacterium]
MRIVTGRLRGRVIPISAKRLGDVKVTASRLKEAVFSRLGGHLDGLHFLDLCAGSGQMALEAYSRGAEVVAVEPDTRRRKALIQLVSEWKVDGGLQIVGRRGGAYLRALDPQTPPFDVVYVDPPYRSGHKDDNLCSALVASVAAAGILADGGLLLAQHPRSVELTDSVGRLHKTDVRSYGTTNLSQFEAASP